MRRREAAWHMLLAASRVHIFEAARREALVNHMLTTRGWDPHLWSTCEPLAAYASHLHLLYSTAGYSSEVASGGHKKTLAWRTREG
jgi:hypothetical protein